MTHPDIFGAISIRIVAATLFGLVARRLGQPLILGYIIGGPCSARTSASASFTTRRASS